MLFGKAAFCGGPLLLSGWALIIAAQRSAPRRSSFPTFHQRLLTWAQRLAQHVERLQAHRGRVYLGTARGLEDHATRRRRAPEYVGVSIAGNGEQRSQEDASSACYHIEFPLVVGFKAPAYAPIITDEMIERLHTSSNTSVQENRELRRLLGHYAASASYNQEVMNRCHDRELLLLTADGLAELLQCMTGSMRLSFELQDIRLLLLDPYGVISELLGKLQLATETFEGLHLIKDRKDVPHFVWATPTPQLERWHRSRHGWVLPGVAGSVAILPLRRADGPVGFLCLASRESDRFTPEHATDFLERFSTICAVCLENAVNRELLRLTGLTDPLTGLFNRRHLDQRLVEESARALRHRHPLACMFVDADHFKRINDDYGHAAGDQVLIQLGRYLRSHLRVSDIATRYGGEEFVILLPATTLASARQLAERICAGVRSNVIPIGTAGEIRLTVSIGVSSLVEDFDGEGEARDAAERLLQAADAAVYAAKLQGRDRVVENPDL